MGLAEPLLKQERVPEAHQYLGAAFDRMPTGIVSRVHEPALRILDRLKSGAKDVA
jgi:hypothetical protein